MQTYDVFKPCFMRNVEALELKLLYAVSNPSSNVFSSTIRIIIAIRKYERPITRQVDLSPSDSSDLKYCMVNENKVFLILVKKNYYDKYKCTGSFFKKDHFYMNIVESVFSRDIEAKIQ